MATGCARFRMRNDIEVPQCKDKLAYFFVHCAIRFGLAMGSEKHSAYDAC